MATEDDRFRRLVRGIPLALGLVLLVAPRPAAAQVPTPATDPAWATICEDCTGTSSFGEAASADSCQVYQANRYENWNAEGGSPGSDNFIRAAQTDIVRVRQAFDADFWYYQIVVRAADWDNLQFKNSHMEMAFGDCTASTTRFSLLLTYDADSGDRGATWVPQGDSKAKFFRDTNGDVGGATNDGPAPPPGNTSDFDCGSCDGYDADVSPGINDAYVRLHTTGGTNATLEYALRRTASAFTTPFGSPLTPCVGRAWMMQTSSLDKSSDFAWNDRNASSNLSSTSWAMDNCAALILEEEEPEVTVTKTSPTTTVPETGGAVTYTFTVENTGPVAFTITSLEDDQFGTLAGDADCQVGTVLDPGESCDFTVVLAVPAGVTGATFVNTFTAEVEDEDEATASDSDDHTVTYTDVAPVVTVTKTSVTTEVPETGDTVTYTFTVENTGAVAFTITSLTDNQFGALAGDGDCQVGTVLAPGASCDFAAAFAVPAGTTGGTFVNTFTALVTDADGTTDSDSDDHTVTYTDVAPEVTVTKSSLTTTVSELGGSVTYTFTVENTGPVAFTITSLTDDQFGALAGDADCQVGTILAPGASCDFDAAFAVPAGTAGDTFVNTFTALVTDADGTTDSDSDDHTVTYVSEPLPEVTVTKTSATTQVFETGGSVTYTFTVDNSGPVAFTITSLEDDQFGTLAGDADCQVGTVLGPGGSCDFEATFDVPAGTPGDTFVNVFTAEVIDADSNTADDSDDHTVTYVDLPPPEVTVSKTSASTQVAEAGATVTYTFTVENSGTVSFTISALEDDQFGPLAGDADCQLGTVLAPGASCDFTEVFAVPPGTAGNTFVNTFTATVINAVGTTDSDSDQHTVSYAITEPDITEIPTLDSIGLLFLALILGAAGWLTLRRLS